MSYLVLARKWRPQTFEDLIGQEHVSRTLSNSIANDRVHHAFLFTGARGVGKTSAARIFAKALNCEQGPTAQPCNRCKICVEITSGRSSDVFEIDGASNTGVDDVRELRENIRYLPSGARYKIFIIDEVHMLSINAFNALLKTLEEPPAHAKFIFATTEPHKIPVTILSRTQRFDFRKIALPKIVERLRSIADAEGLKVSDRALTLVARRGEGSMRDSLSALDQVIAFCGMEIEDGDVQGLLGMVDRRLLLEAAEALLQRDSYRALDLVRRVDHLGHSFRRFCQDLVDVFRSLIILKVVETPGELLDLTQGELRELADLARDRSQEDLQRMAALLLKTEAELASSNFPRLSLEMAMVRLSRLPEARELGSLIRKIEALENRIQASGMPAPSAAPAAAPPLRRSEPRREIPLPPQEPVPRPAAPGEGAFPAVDPPGSGREASASAPGGSWEDVVRHVRGQKAGLASLLEHASLLKLDDKTLEIAYVAGSFYFSKMSDPGTLETLGALVQQCLGRPMQIRVKALDRQSEPPPPSLLQEKKVREEDHRSRVREEALGHPMVQKALEVFGAEVVQVKPLEMKDPGIEAPDAGEQDSGSN